MITLISFNGALRRASFAAIAMTILTPAFATESPLPTAKVSFDDLDMSRSADAEILFKRLRHAAATVCGATPPIEQLERLSIWRHCYYEALTTAVQDVNQPALTQVYLDRSGQRNALLSARGTKQQMAQRSN